MVFILYNQHFNVTDTFALIIRCALPVWTVFSELFPPLLPFSVILYSLLSLLSTLLWSRQLLGVCWSYVCQPIHKKYWPNWSKSDSPINFSGLTENWSATILIIYFFKVSFQAKKIPHVWRLKLPAMIFFVKFDSKLSIFGWYLGKTSILCCYFLMFCLKHNKRCLNNESLNWGNKQQSNQKFKVNVRNYRLQ